MHKLIGLALIGTGAASGLSVAEEPSAMIMEEVIVTASRADIMAMEEVVVTARKPAAGSQQDPGSVGPELVVARLDLESLDFGTSIEIGVPKIGLPTLSLL